jgi:hypothetical protein
MLSNPGPGTSTQTQINGFTLTQTSGAACTPIVTPPSAFPIAVADIVAGSSASVPFTIDFTGCANLAQFSVSVPFSAMSGANTGAITLAKQFR